MIGLKCTKQWAVLMLLFKRSSLHSKEVLQNSVGHCPFVCVYLSLLTLPHVTRYLQGAPPLYHCKLQVIKTWMVAKAWEQGVGKIMGGGICFKYHLTSHSEQWVVLLIRKFQLLKESFYILVYLIWYGLIDSSSQPISRYDLPGPSRPGREYTPLRELPDEGAKFEWRGGLSVFGGPRPCLQCC